MQTPVAMTAVMTHAALVSKQVVYLLKKHQPVTWEFEFELCWSTKE